MIPGEFPELEQQLETEVEREGLNTHRAAILHISRPKLTILGERKPLNDEAFEQMKKERSFTDAEALAELRAQELNALPLGKSRLGGVPDLPATIQWPVNSNGKKLQFACQLDCTLLPRMPGYELPEAGWLYFFAQNNDREFPLPNKVIHYDGQVSHLKRPPAPPLDEMAPSRIRRTSLFDLIVVDGARLDFALPVAGEEDSEEILEDLQDLADNYRTLATRRDTNGVATMFGFGGIEGETPSDMARARAGLEGQDWLLLFQMHQNIPGTNIRWLGDNDLRVYIRESAMRARRFNQTFATVWES